MTERNWQEDMNGCTGLPPTPWAWVETEEAEWIEDSNQEIVIGSEFEYIFDDLLGPNVRKEAFMRFMINAPEALPYWLQQYAALEREYERFRKAAMGWNDDLTKAESLIQQKDAEIAAAEKAYEGLQADCVSRGEYEATLKKLDDMTKAYNALKGDKP
ncbi:hypothetical protein ACU1JV_21955 [Paenibacillus sp. T2-29]